jgi:ACS family hexuronate transporter-like MFS transporter
VLLLGLACAAHQGFSANVFTIASDMFPRRAVGSVVGFGGMMGAVGGMMIATTAGWILHLTGSYHSLFVLAGCTYLLALLVVHLLAPQLEPARIGEEGKA